MRKSLRRYAMGALAIGAAAGGVALTVPHGTPEPSWHPVAYNLSTAPARLLPETVSAGHPVRVVTTTLDAEGRPVVRTRTVTDKAAAESYVATAQRARNAVGVEVDAPMHALDVPTGTDPYRGQQWDLSRIGAEAAWPKSTGSGITVAVIDTGVDATHPDLAGQVLPEYDVIHRTTLDTSTDENGHGTHVAGTIAADTGNGAGISAIAPDARILPIRVLDANGSGDMSDAATGIIYAADHGADVINMSIGSEYRLDAVTEAISYARSKGVVVVAAAGNERSSGSPTSYPAADPGVIAVAATDSTDTVAFYSNAGGYVDVAAPGTGILSTTRGTYQSWNGTSMASPHVAAVAALLKAYRPGLTPDEVEADIENAAVDLGAPGRDDDYGYGRIDAAAALDNAAGATTEPTPADPVTTEPTPTEATTQPTTTEPTPTEPAPTEPAPTPSQTATVTVNGTSRLARYGTTPTVVFTVTAGGAPAAGQGAQLCVSVNGAAESCTARTTGDDGTISWPQKAIAPFKVRLTAGGASAASTYKIQAVATAGRASATSLVVTIGGLDRQTAQVQQLTGIQWRTVRRVKLTAARTTVAQLTAKKRYRIVVPSTSVFAGTTTGAVQL